MSEKVKRHLRFTFYEETIGPAPQITLNYTATARAPGPQKVTFSAGKSKSGGQPQSKKPPPTGLGRVLNDILRKVSQKDTERIFAAPVTEDIAPDYYLVIKNPIDLSVIKAKLYNGEYDNITQFRDDMDLMFGNCLRYNHPGTFFYQEGEKLFNFFRKELKQAKKQILGTPQQPEVSSSSRTASGRETQANVKREVTGVNIPVEFARKERPHDSEAMIRGLPQLDSRVSALYYIPHPPGEWDGDDARFEVACNLISSNEALRGKLKLLRERFPQFILDDAVRKIAGLDEYYGVDAQAVADAMESTADTPGVVGVGRAPIEADAIKELANACPDLPLRFVAGVEEERNELHQQNLRLMLFYNNCMKYWRRSELSPAKAKVMEAIKRNVTKIALEMTPATLVKEQYSRSVIQHIVYSLPKK